MQFLKKIRNQYNRLKLHSVRVEITFRSRARWASQQQLLYNNLKKNMLAYKLLDQQWNTC